MYSNVSLNGPLSRKLEMQLAERVRADRYAERAKAAEQVRLAYEEQIRRECIKRRRLDRLLARLKAPLPEPEQLSLRSGREIIRDTAAAHGMTSDDVRSGGRSRKLAHCRQEVCYLMAVETLLSLPQIGKLINRDHTTVLWGIRQHAKRCGLPRPRGLTPGSRAYLQRPEEEGMTPEIARAR